MPPDAAAAAPVKAVTLSLISHTNAGKTTLARTLLRRDVGEVRDAPHVTMFNESHTLIESGDATLRLWDTPGFGDSARLLKRLKRVDRPVLWFLTQAWDRLTDKPLWCSQQALKNVREEADVVLYLINAAEPPESAGYVAPEMEILGWLSKPVLVLLNQTGPPRGDEVEQAEVALWKEKLKDFSVVKGVLGFDAFARCWVMEDRLLEVIGGLIPAKTAVFNTLQSAWHRRNIEVFEKSCRVIAEQLTASMLDGVEVRAETLVERMGIGRGGVLAIDLAARQVLATKLAERVEHMTNDLIALHSLEGAAERPLLKVSREHFHQPEKVSESIWSVVGTIGGGALGGLIADLKLGGMTFGGGALLGGITAGIGAYALIKTYNLVRADDGRLHWSREHFREQLRLAILCYLAVAHFGRGRGEWREGERPKHWDEATEKLIANQTAAADHAWKLAVEKAAMPDVVHREMIALVSACARDALQSLYRDMKW
jgi:hypothetical protein